MYFLFSKVDLRTKIQNVFELPSRRWTGQWKAIPNSAAPAQPEFQSLTRKNKPPPKVVKMTRKALLKSFLPYILGACTLAIGGNMVYAVINPAFRQFFVDRHPNLGRMMNLFSGHEEPIRQDVDKQEIAKYKETIVKQKT